MREIKFRAWVVSMLSNETGLYYPTMFQLNSDGTVEKLWTTGYKFTSDTCEIFLEQYTGLKDKNGVDIYEGDILKHEKYDNITGLMEWIPSRNGWAEFHPLNQFEVIGNIHENGDLVK